MSITNGPNLGLMVNGAQGEAHYSQFMAFLRGVDALVQCKVKSATTAAQPGSPTDGDTYLLPTGSTGAAWASNDGKIARWSSAASAWEFYTAQNGWETYAQDTGVYWFRVGGAWTSQLKVGNGTASTTTTTGDLVVAGGVGIGGALFVGGQSNFSCTLSGGSTSLGNSYSTVFQNTGGTNRCFIGVAQANPSGASTAGTTGFEARADLNGNATNIPSGDFIGVTGSTRINTGTASGSVVRGVGCQGSVSSQNASVTVSDARAFWALAVLATGPVTNAYGFFSDNQKASGTTNSFAFYAAAQSLGGFSFYSAGTGPASFGDYVDLRGAGNILKVNGAQVIAAQQTGMGATLGASTAGATYTAAEQTMLQNVYNKMVSMETKLKAHGLIAT